MNLVTFLLLLFQTPTASPLPTPHVPERTPALFTLIYVGGFGLIILLLLLGLLRSRKQTAPPIPEDLPKEVKKRLGSHSTNRGLRALRWLFVLLSIGLFSFHIYWAHYASEKNEKFQQLSYKDLRARRLSESTLRGWIFDRSGRVDQPLAYYKRDSSGNIRREYPMDKALAHIFGSDRGDPGLERALFGVESGVLPEALEVVKGKEVEFRGNQDVRLTIDRALQQAAVDQLKGKHGAVVILNPQTGDVLAMYSEPSYSLAEVDDEATWIRLEANERDKPLVSRALGAYYIPGSTFKTVTMTAAFLAGEQNTEFTCSGGGYYAAPGANVIFDDGGPGEVHGRIGIDHAYEVSCNQYFAQMGVKLGAEKLKRAAQLLGIGSYDTPSEALRGRKLPQIWDASTDAVKRALAPREATIVTGKQVTRYDLALMGYGQGYAGQMTPFQMALAAAAIGNMEGKLMKPRIEMNVAPQPFNQVMTPATAARLRQIMGLVTGGASGTARGVFGPVKAAGINTGGKTGTAQKVVPVYDPKTGEPKTRHKIEKDNKGNIIREYDEVIMDNENPRIDGWFLCLAPIERPQLAMAVIVEGGGYGSRSAAPIAAALVLKARDLGYFK
ncbi:MAG TPA: penicillin-binding transpeptidase domain-containing protein [Pyrinomonadaceae bacterium]|jgi:penicillin-binding protein A|nr:penicillin-binding transpeptidase domain-containing protein [Pyrinomonadaceae bacterium]